jgi:integron integrase
MFQVPPQIVARFQKLLFQKSIPKASHFHYQKWLRYYLDFCNKYQFSPANKQSLSRFTSKLAEKRQTQEQQRQAAHAVSLYYQLNASSSAPLNHYQFVPLETAESKERNGGWKAALDDLSAEIKTRHYSPKTLKAYTLWATQFRNFTQFKETQALSSKDVKEFMRFLAVKREVSASTQNQAFNALLFFYRHILKRDFGEHKDNVRAKRKPYIPVVLSREEVDLMLKNLSYPYDLVAKLLYGCGLRLFECLNLRVQNFNFDAGILTIHDGKGKKDRTVPLPQKIIPELKAHLENVRDLHQRDLDGGYSGAFMIGILEKKYKNAGKELVWQWFFPAKTLTVVPSAREMRRYHLHETHVQRAIKRAVRKSRLLKRVSAHTFRHSFATHLLQANYDIRTIQELLGHSDVRTTMIYTHTIRSRTLKEARSPLDF